MFLQSSACLQVATETRNPLCDNSNFSKIKLNTGDICPFMPDPEPT